MLIAVSCFRIFQWVIFRKHPVAGAQYLYILFILQKQRKLSFFSYESSAFNTHDISPFESCLFLIGSFQGNLNFYMQLSNINKSGFSVFTDRRNPSW